MRQLGWGLVFIIFLLAGCQEERFTAINPHQEFIATMNILEPSLTFYDPAGENLATWPFDVAYTGAELIQQDRVLVYGHELSEAHIYELSSGEKVKTINTSSGTTNAYYDEKSELFYLTNSKTNTITSYDLQGKEQAQQKLYNYPMSMLAHDGKLYVVNYKDTVLSVLDSKTLNVLDEWTIEDSSHGLLVVEEQLWIGGHGQGLQANETVDVYNLDTGQLQQEISAPLMPIGLAQVDEKVAIISHGESMLYEVDAAGNTLHEMKIGANPFAVTFFADYIVVAGYDDHQLYFIQDHQVVKKVETDAGPFQLLRRENGR